MKKISIICAVLMLSVCTVKAQKFGYVDSDYILKKVPAYNAAQGQLEKMSKQYQTDVEAKYKVVQELYNKYQAEKALLTDEMRQKRENEIITREKEVKEFQSSHFSPEGTLAKKREELLKPIQDKVYNAIKDISTEGGYAVIFDIANNPGVVYNNPRYDLSDKVLEKMGFK
ncbi:MAG: OmpH family outer membrane protein [Prevotellaceae bacterium]|jgi:outer membrane protein|nr:OmpH family outer membrane protein [Prevotellaceae bacterium]